MSGTSQSTSNASRAQVHGLPPAAEPFLAEIAAQPFADLPRLIFADWLEEQGDPRADFIRVQCARERLDDDEPAAQALADREADLWAACGAAWQSVLPAVSDATFVWDDPFSWMGWVDNPESRPGLFVRGFPAGVTLATVSAFHQFRPWLEAGLTSRVQFGPLSAESIAELAQADLLQTASELAIDLSAVASPVAASPYLDQVERLTITCSMIDDGDVESLFRNRLKRLTALGLGTNTLTNSACDTLARWPHAPLVELHLPDNRLTSDGVRALADSAHGDSLEGLDLQGNRLALIDLARRGREWPRLRRLALDNALVTDRGPGGHWLRPMPRLERLSLAGNAWSAELSAWLMSGSLPRLRRLNLQRTGLQPGDLGLLLQNGLGGIALRRLNLSRNPLGDEGPRTLLRFAATPALSELVELNLDRTQIGEASYRALCEWPRSSPLVRLSLVDNAAMSPAIQDRLRMRFGLRVVCDRAM